MPEPLTVTYVDGDRFDIAIGRHTVRVDQPIEAGGRDTAPTPTELFVASIASCVAFYARRFLSRHGLPAAGLEVTASYEFASRPARVGAVRVEIAVPDGVPAESRDALLAVASHCTVHNSLTLPPAVTVELATAAVGV